MTDSNQPSSGTERPRKESGDGGINAAAGFATTRWSIVVQAGAEGEEARDALADLCRAYWYPLYAFVRSKGYSPEDAEDRTQGFFTQLLEREDVRKAEKSRGKFRSFLLSSLNHYLTSVWRKENAIKRGRDVQLLEIDGQEGEERLRNEPRSERTAEDDFDRRWALETLDQATSSLRSDYEKAGKGELFEALQPGLAGGGEVGPYAKLGERLGLSEGAVTMAIKRLRARFAECIRQEVMKTVNDEENFQSEMHSLYAALGR